MLDVLIIGGGPAGLSAGIYSYRKELETLIVCTELGGQVTKSGEIENYLGVGRVTGPELSEMFRSHIELLKIPLKQGVAVTGLKKLKVGFETTLDNGEKIESKSVIVSSGKMPRELGVPGEEEFKNKGVSYCATCDGPLFRGKSVAVVGGGNSALDAALSLVAVCKEVHLINIYKTFKGDPVFLSKVEKHPQVTIHLDAKTTKIEGDSVVKSLTYETLTDKKVVKLDVSGVFVAIGQIPVLDFDTLTDKNKYGMIEYGQDGKTNVPGLFAAGDATSIRDNQIAVAVGDGTRAALSAYEYLLRHH